MEPLQLQPFDQIYLLTRLRYADGRAVCYCENHCLPARVPELLQYDLNGSLTEVYESHYNLVYTSMHLSFYPTAMPAQAAQALGVMEGRPALLLRRLNYDQHGRVLDLDIEYWRHDSLRIEVDTHQRVRRMLAAALSACQSYRLTAIRISAASSGVD